MEKTLLGRHPSGSFIPFENTGRSRWPESVDGATDRRRRALNFLERCGDRVKSSAG